MEKIHVQTKKYDFPSPILSSQYNDEVQMTKYSHFKRKYNSLSGCFIIINVSIGPHVVTFKTICHFKERPFFIFLGFTAILKHFTKTTSDGNIE